MSDLNKSIGDLPVNVENEALIIVNAIKNADNREVFLKRVDYREFRLKEFQTLAYAIKAATDVGADLEPRVLALKSKSCPIRYYIDPEVVASMLTKYDEVSSRNFAEHLETLKIDNIRSELVDRIFNSLYRSVLDPTMSLSGVEERLRSMQEIVQQGYSISKSEFKTLNEVLDDFMEERESGIFHRTTGFRRLDGMLTDGLKDGQVSIVCGRPNMGKSSFLLSMQKNLANKGVFTPQFALEMPNRNLMTKLIAFNCDMPIGKIAADWKYLTSRQKEYLESELLRLRKNERILFNDKPTQGLADIREQIMLLQDRLETTYMVVGIDLFGKIRDFQSSDNFARDYEKSLNQTQVMTRDLGVHMCLVAQISRSTTRKNQRPKMNDIKNAGAWEEVADLIMAIHRDNYDPEIALQQQLTYGPEPELDEMSLNAEVAELLILKARMSGANRIAYFLFDNVTTHFSEIDPEYQEVLQSRMQFEGDV